MCVEPLITQPSYRGVQILSRRLSSLPVYGTQKQILAAFSLSIRGQCRIKWPTEHTFIFLALVKHMEGEKIILMEENLNQEDVCTELKGIF